MELEVNAFIAMGITTALKIINIIIELVHWLTLVFRHKIIFHTTATSM